MKGAAIAICLVMMALIAGLTVASPVSLTYSGEVWTSSSDNLHGSGNGLWDYEWDLTWTSAETVSYFWVDINNEVSSADILSNKQTTGWVMVSDTGVDYYTGKTNDPYGVPTGDKVLLWQNSSATGTSAVFGVTTTYTVLPGSPFNYLIYNSNPIGTTSGTTTSLTPEPGSMAVLLLGLGAVGGLLRKRKHKLAE